MVNGNIHHFAFKWIDEMIIFYLRDFYLIVVLMRQLSDLFQQKSPLWS